MMNDSPGIVSKYGGTSLADAANIANVARIIRSNTQRRCIIPSAAGKRFSDDTKITDLFLEWHENQSTGLPCDRIQNVIETRHLEIVSELNLPLDLTPDLQRIADDISIGASKAYAASRGEFLMGKIMATVLGYEFIDPARCIFFDQNGRYQQNDPVLQALIGNKRVVLPGFYGSEMSDDSIPTPTSPDLIRTFTRGGSDLTGAIVARAIGAERYEKWTDVPGLRMADPKIVANPRAVRVLTYREARELSYMGASIFHEEATFPVREAKIPIHILSTRDPHDAGTMIVPEDVSFSTPGQIVGIAGKTGFTVTTIEKEMMNQEVGFARRILTVLEKHKVSFEHMPGGIDTLSVIIHQSQLGTKLPNILEGIREEVVPDSLKATPNMAMIAIVGRAMAHTPGVAARIFGAIARVGINVTMINQGSSEISVIIGVNDEDHGEAVRALYAEFAN